MTKAAPTKLPLQPIYIDKNGSPRFRSNKLVEYLLSQGGVGLNRLAVVFSGDEYNEDREQFAQLIGYSLSGFGELSYVSDETYQAAEAIAEGRVDTEEDARRQYLEDCVEAARKAVKELAPALFKIHPDDLQP